MILLPKELLTVDYGRLLANFASSFLHHLSLYNLGEAINCYCCCCRGSELSLVLSLSLSHICYASVVRHCFLPHTLVPSNTSVCADEPFLSRTRDRGCREHIKTSDACVFPLSTRSTPVDDISQARDRERESERERWMRWLVVNQQQRWSN